VEGERTRDHRKRKRNLKRFCRGNRFLFESREEGKEQDKLVGRVRRKEGLISNRWLEGEAITQGEGEREYLINDRRHCKGIE